MSVPDLISQRTSGASRPWRTSERLKAFSASTRVSPAAASSTASRPSPSGSSPGSVATPAGDRPELVAAGQVVLDDDEVLLQLDGDLDHRGQDDDEGAGLLAGGEPGVEGLDDLGGAEEAVEVAEHQDGGAVGRGQGGQRADRGQRVGGAGDGAGPVGLAGDGQAAVDVPGGQGPALVAAEAGDLGDGVVVLVGADPEAGEAGADVLGQALGERHGVLLGLCRGDG